MTTIVTRAGKGSPLTNAEVDSNFTNLNTDKYEIPSLTGNSGKFLTTDGLTSYWGDLPPSGVTSVGLSLPNIFTVTNSPVTSTGDLTATLASQSNHLVFASPTGGLPGAPTFRALANEDLPATISVTNLTGTTVNATNLNSSSGSLNLNTSSGANATFCSSQGAGTLIVGGSSQTGAITLGRSTASHTINLHTGATASGNTKTLNLGTGGLSGSTTNITLGSEFGTIGTFNGNWTFAATAFFQDAEHYLALTSGNAIHNLDSTDYWNYARASNTLTLVIGAVTRLTVDGSGNLTASGNITSNSDARLKLEIETIESALSTVEALRGTRFLMNGKRQIGVVAQEVQAVLPEVVLENEDGYLSVAYGNLTAVLIEAVKELSAEVTMLKTRVGG